MIMMKNMKKFRMKLNKKIIKKLKIIKTIKIKILIIIIMIIECYVIYAKENFLKIELKNIY